MGARLLKAFRSWERVQMSVLVLFFNIRKNMVKFILKSSGKIKEKPRKGSVLCEGARLEAIALLLKRDFGLWKWRKMDEFMRATGIRIHRLW